MRDPRRRNRNIGTARSGHGSNNRLAIPDRWSDLSVYWERLNNFVLVEKSVRSHTVTFLVEPIRTGYLHHCTIQDVTHVLELLPGEHVCNIKLLVFRQPTKKQAVLASVWGRLAYWSEIGGHEGPGIYLESQPIDHILEWPKSLAPDRKAELKRLEDAGFKINRHSRGYQIQTTLLGIRATQLYRTIPHEIGHYVDYLECQHKLPWGKDWERFWQLYDAKPTREKEFYAHRYADEFCAALTEKKQIPFAPKHDIKLIQEDGLDPMWFAAPSGAL